MPLHADNLLLFAAFDRLNNLVEIPTNDSQSSGWNFNRLMVKAVNPQVTFWQTWLNCDWGSNLTCLVGSRPGRL